MKASLCRSLLSSVRKVQLLAAQLVFKRCQGFGFRGARQGLKQESRLSCSSRRRLLLESLLRRLVCTVLSSCELRGYIAIHSPSSAIYICSSPPIAAMRRVAKYQDINHGRAAFCPCPLWMYVWKPRHWAETYLAADEFLTQMRIAFHLHVYTDCLAHGNTLITACATQVGPCRSAGEWQHARARRSEARPSSRVSAVRCRSHLPQALCVLPRALCVRPGRAPAAPGPPGARAQLRPCSRTA